MSDYENKEIKFSEEGEENQKLSLKEKFKNCSKREKTLIISALVVAVLMIVCLVADLIIEKNKKYMDDPTQIFGDQSQSEIESGEGQNLNEEEQLFDENGLEYIYNPTTKICRIDSRGTNEEAEIVIKSEVNGHKVTEISDDTFANDIVLTKVTIPEGIEKIGNNAFRFCSALKEIEIPSSVKTIGDFAFSGCTVLEKVTMNDGVEEIGFMIFGDCAKLTDIKLSANLKKISPSAFLNVPLKSITLPSSITEIGDNAFNGVKIESITIPHSCEKIGSTAFSNCANLKEVIIGNGVKEIGSMAFSKTNALAEIIIPESVEKMGEWVFDYKTNLCNVHVVAEEKPAGWDENWDATNNGEDIVVHFGIKNPS